MRDAPLHADATLTLAPGVSVASGCLRDGAGGEYPVDPQGESVARLCATPMTLSRLVEAIAAPAGLDVDGVDDGLRRFVMQLQAHRLLSVHQSFLRELGREFSLWPFDVVDLVLSRRLPLRRFSSRRIYPATTSGIVRAVVESYSFLPLAAIAMIAVAVVLSNIVDPLDTALAIDRSAILGLVMAGATLLILGAALAHEAGHLLGARVTGIRMRGVQARRGAASVLFVADGMRATRVTVLAGPLVGAAFAGVCALVLLGAGSPGWELAAIDNVRLTLGLVAVLIVPSQLLALLPLFGDGRALKLARSPRPVVPRERA